MEAQITSIHRMTPRVKQFELERTDGDAFDFEPGQHTHVHVERDGEEEVRPYTPTSRPGTSKTTLAIKRYDDGTVSRYMHERERGDAIEIEPPDGNLHLRDAESDVVFVSTGTGITPTMAMLRQYLAEGSGDARFLYGEKTQADLMYRETLDALEAEHEDLTVSFSLSQEDWDGHSGHVQDQLEAVVDDPADRDYYVCGVPEMVVETKERLSELGVPESAVYSEGWEDEEVADGG